MRFIDVDQLRAEVDRTIEQSKEVCPGENLSYNIIRLLFDIIIEGCRVFEMNNINTEVDDNTSNWKFLDDERKKLLNSLE